MAIEPLSPELRGGLGVSFEDKVAAVYLAALLTETSAPGVLDGIVTRVALQQAAMAEPLDDVIVDGSTPTGSPFRLSLQVKTQITISAAATNTDFRETVAAAAETMDKPDFREGVDWVGLVTGTIAAAKKRALLSVCNLARGSASFDAFHATLFTPGVADDTRRGAFRAFATILAETGRTDCEQAAFMLLRHFILVDMDLLHPGATSEAMAIATLAQALRPEAAPSAPELWGRLGRVAREGATAAAVFNRSSLVAQLRGAYRLAGAPSLQRSLRLMAEQARSALAEIRNEIGGKTYARREALKDATESTAVITFVAGQPGTGKSAVLRRLAEDALNQGPVLVLKADRLVGRTWREYAMRVGFGDEPLADVLVELSGVGANLVFLDGIDRVEVENRGLVHDVLTTVLAVNARTGLRAVLTVRGEALEPLQNWLPERVLVGAGARVVTVEAFGDDECREIVADLPALAPLLFGEPRVSEIARRPFFTAELARAARRANAVMPQRMSEIDLAELWWERGGLSSDGAMRTLRQQTLLRLARAGAPRLGHRIPIEDLHAEAVEELRADGMIRETLPGHLVGFTHDIYFEWAFLQLLIGRRDAWPAEVARAGEPPALARPVELLSQRALERQVGWSEGLRSLEQARMRPQWRRTWLLAPFGSPRFADGELEVEEVLFSGDTDLFRRVVLWFQAERTRPNPAVLAGMGASAALEPIARKRTADALAWPTDLATWTRFLGFVLRTLPRQQPTFIPALAEAFGVWQNLFRSLDLDAPISRRICAVVDDWLVGIESWRHADVFVLPPPGWLSFPRGLVEELESKLRWLLLSAGRREGARFAAYLRRVAANQRLAQSTFDELSSFAPLLVEQGHASLLREITLVALLAPLPEVVRDEARRHGDPYYSSPSPFDWITLSVGGHSEFSPPSPSREPFKSLFIGAPDEARLLVQELTNHATTAWRQLSALDHERNSTPIVARVLWPWGERRYWGNTRTYVWPRGTWAPHVVSTGLMALEAWALKELQAGRLVDDVIHDVVEGHECNAVLSTAVLLAMVDGHGSLAAGSLVASQRVWRWDERRFAHDLTSSSNLTGFTSPSDRSLAEAVRALNKVPARMHLMQSLAMALVLHGGERGEATRTAIRLFADDLPFDYEEEQGVPNVVEALQQAAAERVPMAALDNYKIEPAAEPNRVLVSFDDPLARDPKRLANSQHAEQYLNLVNVAIRASNALDQGDAITVVEQEELLAIARAADRADLFNTSDGAQATRTAGGAVASAAAACLELAPEMIEDDFLWCRSAVLRASALPASQDDWDSPQMIPVFHPVGLAARGIAGLARRGRANDEELDLLLRASVHPIEAVARAAATAAVGLHELHPRLALATLAICVERAVVPAERFHLDGRDARRRREQDRLQQILDGWKRWLRDSSPAFEVCALPDPLPPPADERNGRPRPEALTSGPSAYLHYKFLAEFLGGLPVEALAASAIGELFLSLLQRLARWTVASLTPAQEVRRQRRGDDRRHADLMLWTTTLYPCLARASMVISVERSRQMFLDSALALPDDEAAMLMSPFVARISTRGVLDPKVASDVALALLRACAERVARMEQLAEQSYEERGVHGHYLPGLIRDLLFVQIEGAGGATRFANGEYSDLPLIIPIVDALAPAAARSRTGLDAYLSLCERSRGHFPAKHFVDLVLDLLSPDGSAPRGWLGTSIPGRIAALIHDLAERDHPLALDLSRDMLRILDSLVDIGDRRSAALQSSQIFREIRIA